jgi:hypothetical protein
LSLIPHYDPADGKLLNLVTEDVAQQYVAGGIAHAVHRKNGRIARLYRRVRERAYGTAQDGIAGLRAASSQTMRRVRFESGLLLHEHRRADAWGRDSAFWERCEGACNIHQDRFPESGCICPAIYALFCAGDPLAIELISGRSAEIWYAATQRESLRTFASDHKWQISSGMKSAVRERGPVTRDKR